MQDELRSPLKSTGSYALTCSCLSDCQSFACLSNWTSLKDGPSKNGALSAGSARSAARGMRQKLGRATKGMCARGHDDRRDKKQTELECQSSHMATAAARPVCRSTQKTAWTLQASRILGATAGAVTRSSQESETRDSASNGSGRESKLSVRKTSPPVTARPGVQRGPSRDAQCSRDRPTFPVRVCPWRVPRCRYVLRDRPA